MSAANGGRNRRVIAVNESFREQRVTGQQRYAGEIADRLLREPGVVAARPGARFSGGLKTWAWVMGVLPFGTARQVLLSLTSRTPFLHPRHVVVVHDLFVLTNPEWYSKAYYLSHAPLLRVAVRQAKEIVAVSEPVARQLAESGMTKARISVAPNAPSPFFQAAVAAESVPDASATVAPGVAADPAIVDRLGLTADRFILVVGSLDPRKNLARLAEAYRSLDSALTEQFPLVVVGGGHAIFGDASVDWPSETVLAGYVSDAELAGLYRGARGVVFPSLAEGFGLPLVEAAVSGARLAVSDIDVFRWIGGDAVSYFDPLSVEAIAASMTDLMSEDAAPVDPAFARSIRERFDWEKSAATVLEACRRVAER